MFLFGTLQNANIWVKRAFQLSGYLIVFLIWHLLTTGENPVVPKGILPSPKAVFSAFKEVLFENDLVTNFFYSLGLNIGGYIEAILIAIPLGFVIGLVYPIRLALKGIVDAIRYVSLPAVLGLFIAWFGIGSPMKIHFLAFGILIYLLPIVVQRIDEVKEVYLKTVYTIGASRWQTIKTVYFPSVISRISDDIRVLTAISWTYIIISEAIGGEGGIGALIWRVGLRRGRLDKVFALLLVIILVGILQDALLVRADRKWFPYKYIERTKHGESAEGSSTLGLVRKYILSLSGWIMVALVSLLLLNELIPILGEPILTYLFKDTVWVVWVLGLMFLGFTFWGLYKKKKYPYLARTS